MPPTVKVECASFRTYVPPSELVKRSDYTVYQLDCCLTDAAAGYEHKWTVYKRFREVTTLHSAVSKLYRLFAESEDFNPLHLENAKQYIQTTICRHEMRRAQCEARRQGITQYLQTLVGNPSVWALIPVKEFFELL